MPPGSVGRARSADGAANSTPPPDGITTRPISHISPPSIPEFLQRYVEPSVPVVISGACEGWTALRAWTHRWFADGFGDRSVAVSHGSPLDGRRVEMPLGEYLGQIDGGRGAGDPTGGAPPGRDDDDRPYLRLCPLPGVLPELLDDFTTPAYCPAERRTIVNLWLGPAGTVQPFHKDNQNDLSPVHNLLVQVRGRKRVSLVSADQDDKMYRFPPEAAAANYSQVDYADPDLDRFPLFGSVEVLETIVAPGEMIFIPAGTWHHVRALDPSISLSFWWFASFVADAVARLASSSQGPPPGRPIGEDDVIEFGGIWALAVVARSLSEDRRRALVQACSSSVGALLAEALDRLAQRGDRARVT